MLLVKVGVQGSKVTEYALADGLKVRDALVRFYDRGSRPPQSIINLNGSDRTSGIEDSPLRNNDVIIIRDRGRQIRIKISKLGERLLEVDVDPTMNIATALAIAGKSPALNEEVWVHYENIQKGERIGLSESVREGMILIVERKKDSLKDRIVSVMRKHTGHTYNSDYFINELIEVMRRG